MGDISYLERAAKLGVQHQITGVGCTGSYLSINRRGHPITVSDATGRSFERTVDEAERALATHQR